MAVGRAERFEERRSRVALVFGDDADTLGVVSDLFALMEMAWHDAYDEITPPESVIDSAPRRDRQT